MGGRVTGEGNVIGKGERGDNGSGREEGGLFEIM